MSKETFAEKQDPHGVDHHDTDRHQDSEKGDQEQPTHFSSLESLKVPPELLSDSGSDLYEISDQAEEDTSLEEVPNELPDLELLLKETYLILQGGEETEQMIKKRQHAIDRIATLETLKSIRLQRLEEASPLANLKTQDYDDLVREEIIEETHADFLKNIIHYISLLESRDNKSSAEEDQLQNLLHALDSHHKKIQFTIRERRREILDQQSEITKKYLIRYAERAKRLEDVIAEIEKNPKVIDRLREMAEKEMKEAEEAFAEHKKEVLSEVHSCIQVLEHRNSVAIKRLADVLGDENFSDNLISAHFGNDREEQKKFTQSTRDKLVSAIIDAEGEKQIKSEEEVVPWFVKSTSRRYGDSLRFLKSSILELKEYAESGDKKAAELLKRAEDALYYNEALYRLFGPQKYKVKDKTGRMVEKTSAFWSAFEKRRQNDISGETKARKEAKIKRQEELKKQAEQKIEHQKAIEDLESRGGFRVKIPVYKSFVFQGKRSMKLVNETDGYVRVEKFKSKSDKDMVRIVETLDIPDELLRIGQEADAQTFGSFPSWLRKEIVFKQLE